jgi:hypothetical protein
MYKVLATAFAADMAVVAQSPAETPRGRTFARVLH